MKFLNMCVQVSNYATGTLNETLNRYGQKGFKFVNAVLAKNQYGCEVMYLFFTKQEGEAENDKR